MKQDRMFSWMHPGLEIRETGRHGKGVFSGAAIARNETLIVMGGYILTVEDENNLTGIVADKPIELSDRFSIGPRNAADLALMPQSYVNHSCDPNCGFKGQIFLVALRDIAAGEEVSCDYAMVMHSSPDSDSYFSMPCHCGSPLCRDAIREDDWQLPELQARYDGYFTWFLQEKIDALRGTQGPRE